MSACSSSLLPCVAWSSPSPVIVGPCVALLIFQSSAVVHRPTGLARRSRGGRPGVTMLDDILPNQTPPLDRLMFKFFLIYMMQVLLASPALYVPFSLPFLPSFSCVSIRRIGFYC